MTKIMTRIIIKFHDQIWPTFDENMKKFFEKLETAVMTTIVTEL